MGLGFRVVQWERICLPMPEMQEISGSVPGWGRSPGGGGNRNSLQYSCLENSIDRGACQATVHRVAKSQTGLSARAHTHTHGLGLPPSHHYQFNVLWDHQMIVLSENSKSLNSCFLNFNMCNNCLDVSLLETNSDSQAPCKDHDSLCKVWSPGVSIRITSFRMQWPMVGSKKQNSTLLIHL